MKISLNWIKDYVDLPNDIELVQICHDLTMATVEVEGAVHTAAALDAIYIGKVVGVSPIHEMDNLRAVVCDVGGEQLNIVCGASNLSVGMLVLVALPGAKIQPRGKGPPVEVKVADIGGVLSKAVICAPNEIGLAHLFPEVGDTEILDVSDIDCKSGQKLADAIGWNDIVLEIDNKSLTNRPDLWGHYGIAREMAAIYGKRLKALPFPQIYAIRDDLTCEIKDSNQCRRFVTMRIEGVKVQKAPFWMRSRLAMLGQKAINMYVDLANYVMFAVGQPSHVFDATKLQLPLQVRQSLFNEKLTLLDGKEVVLASRVHVVADQEKSVSLAGVMGGLKTSVTTDTNEIIFECANFHPLSIRRSSTHYGVRTESSSRYEKGLDPDRIDQALGLFQSLLCQAQPEARITGMADTYPTKLKDVSVQVSLDLLYKRLGLRLKEKNILDILEILGFGVTMKAEVLIISVPSWRATGDVSLPEDIVEEVARLYGYERFPFFAPKISLETPVLQPAEKQERRLREYLAFTGGMREVVTYHWSEDRMLEAAGMEDVPTVNLDMPPAPDQHRLRPSLVPNLIKAVHDNLRYYSNFRIFEMGRVFLDKPFQSPDAPNEFLPEQPKHLAAALVGDNLSKQFRQSKGLLEQMGTLAQVRSFSFGEALSPPAWADQGACFDLSVDGRTVGVMGLLSSSARRLAGIKHGHAVIFEINMEDLEPLPSRDNRYQHLPKYPQVDFDISLLFPTGVKWRDIQREVESIHDLICEVSFVDEYQGNGIPEGNKSITLRLRLGSSQSTLTTEQVPEVSEQVVTRLKDALGAFAR